MNLIERDEYCYTDEASGLIVFTEKYHLERGYCCGHGCKHCPYNYQEVPETKKSQVFSKANKAVKEKEHE